MTTDGHWMQLAIDWARKGLSVGQTPFGAVVVRGDELVAGAHNRVRLSTDPTAHAEVECIRAAAAKLKTIDFSACMMYTTCEPCPMCAAAIHWAGFKEVVYGATIADADSAGFRELRLPAAELLSRGSATTIRDGVMPNECAALFQEWKDAGGVAY